MGGAGVGKGDMGESCSGCAEGGGEAEDVSSNATQLGGSDVGRVAMFELAELKESDGDDVVRAVAASNGTDGDEHRAASDGRAAGRATDGNSEEVDRHTRVEDAVAVGGGGSGSGGEESVVVEARGIMCKSSDALRAAGC